MQKTRITKEDGRYLIFYTFDEDSTAEQPTVDADQQSKSKEEHPANKND